MYQPPLEETCHPDHFQDHNYRDWTKPEKYDDAIFKSGKGHVESILLFVRIPSISSAISHDLTVSLVNRLVCFR